MSPGTSAGPEKPSKPSVNHTPEHWVCVGPAPFLLPALCCDQSAAQDQLREDLRDLQELKQAVGSGRSVPEAFVTRLFIYLIYRCNVVVLLCLWELQKPPSSPIKKSGGHGLVVHEIRSLSAGGGSACWGPAAPLMHRHRLAMKLASSQRPYLVTVDLRWLLQKVQRGSPELLVHQTSKWSTAKRGALISCSLSISLLLISADLICVRGN